MFYGCYYTGVVKLHRYRYILFLACSTCLSFTCMTQYRHIYIFLIIVVYSLICLWSYHSCRHIYQCYIQTITMTSRLLIFYRERACFYTECYFKINETFAFFFFTIQYNMYYICIFKIRSCHIVLNFIRCFVTVEILNAFES